MMRKNVFIKLLILLPLLVTSCALGQGPDRAQIESIFSEREVVNLVFAVAKGDLATIKRLVSNGVDPNFIGINGETPLIVVLDEWDSPSVSGVQTIISLGADPLIQETQYGKSALWLSARQKKTDYLETILQTSIDVDLYHEKREPTPTALFIAVERSNNDHVQLLLEAGADPNLPNESGRTLLIDSALLSNWEAAYYLLQAGADYTVTLPKSDKTIVGILENRRYNRIPFTTDWRQKVIEFLRAEGIEVKPWNGD